MNRGRHDERHATHTKTPSRCTVSNQSRPRPAGGGGIRAGPVRGRDPRPAPGLCESDNVVRATVSAEHRATQKTYEINVRVTGDAPNNSTSRAWLPVDEDGGLVYQCRGSISEGESQDIDWVNLSLKADQLYAIVLKGQAFGDTDRTLEVPYVGGLLSMSVLQNGTTALGAPYFSHQDGWARVLFKPETDGDYQVVVTGLGEDTGTYDLRVRPATDDHFPNGTGSKTTVVDVLTDSTVTPGAAATGKLYYAFDSDWFRASGLVPSKKYVVEARPGTLERGHGDCYLYVDVYDARGHSLDFDREGTARIVFQPDDSEEEQDYYFRVYAANRSTRSPYALYLHDALSLEADAATTLTVDPSEIFDPDGTARATRLDSWRYEWYRTGDDGQEERIEGARGSSYRTTGNDVAKPVRARVCYLPDNAVRVRECRYSEDAGISSSFNVILPYDTPVVTDAIEAGASFRLLVVSLAERTAEESDIEVYNEWIQSQLRTGWGPIQAHAGYFQALVSNESFPARLNTGTGYTATEPGLPVYWLAGIFKAADDYQDFWDGSWDYRDPGLDSTGLALNFNSSDYVWTGTASGGSGSEGNQMGASFVAAALPDAGAGHEVYSAVRPATERHHLYGLSGVFVIEEPDTPYLLRTGGIAVTSTPTAATNTYGQGEEIEFTLTFSEAVNVTGDPQFRFGMGTRAQARQAGYVSGSGTTKLVFRYTVQAIDSAEAILWQSHLDDRYQPFLLDEDDRITDISNTDNAVFFSITSTLRDHQVNGRLTSDSSMQLVLQRRL